MKDLADVHVAILAGGLGTRLSPILPGQQKVVAKVKEHPFLEYVLHQLNKAHLKNIVICIGYLGDQVKDAFGDNYQGLSLSYSKEHMPLGTAGAVAQALPFLPSDDILITNGDTFYDCDLQNFYAFHLRKKANVSIILKHMNDTSRYGKVTLDESDQIIGFEEKKLNGGPGFINGGVYFMKRSMLSEIPKGKSISFEKELFPLWIGKDFYGFVGEGKFIDIGTPQSYKDAQSFFSS